MTTQPMPSSEELSFMANTLYEEGVVVVPMDAGCVQEARKHWLEYLDNIPEHHPHFRMPPTQSISPGGFGAGNLASCFHNPAYHYSNDMAMRALEPVFSRLAERTGHSQLEPIPDRMIWRPKGFVISGEPHFHRDQAKTHDRSDFFLSVMINLNDGTPQYFTCCPGTHITNSSMDGNGFTPISPSESDAYAAQEKLYTIPPNCALIFAENILHRVPRGVVRTPGGILRHMIGFCLTNRVVDWHPENETHIKDQAPLYYKGSEQPRAYPKLWWINHCDKLMLWGQGRFRFPDKEKAISTTKKGDEDKEHMQPMGKQLDDSVDITKANALCGFDEEVRYLTMHATFFACEL